MHWIGSIGRYFSKELTFGIGLPATARATELTTCLVFDSQRLASRLRRNHQIGDALKSAHFRHACQKFCAAIITPWQRAARRSQLDL